MKITTFNNIGNSGKRIQNTDSNCTGRRLINTRSKTLHKNSVVTSFIGCALRGIDHILILMKALEFENCLARMFENIYFYYYFANFLMNVQHNVGYIDILSSALKQNPFDQEKNSLGGWSSKNINQEGCHNVDYH